MHSLPRVLFINNSSKLGTGTAASLLLLIKYLKEDFDFAVVSDRHSTLLPEALAKIQIPHYALPDRVALYLPSLIKTIVKDKFDLVYGNGSNQRSRGAFWAAKITRRPFVWHIRETLRDSKYAYNLRYANAVIANSKDTAEHIRQFAEVKNPILIENGVDLNEFKQDRQIMKDLLERELNLNPGWVRIINMGRIGLDKNQMDVVKVADQVVKRYPQTHFIIVGYVQNNEYLMNVRREIEKRDLQRNVIIHDYTPEVSKFLCGSDLMLHTAQKEPQGRVILEAMAAGLPVAAYNVGGIGEAMVDQQTGFLLPFGDLDGLVQAVCKLISNSNLRTELGIKGYHRVKDFFSADVTAMKVKAVIKDVFAGNSLK